MKVKVFFEGVQVGIAQKIVGNWYAKPFVFGKEKEQVFSGEYIRRSKEDAMEMVVAFWLDDRDDQAAK